jgi:PAS domain S-box-containing protein
MTRQDTTAEQDLPSNQPPLSVEEPLNAEYYKRQLEAVCNNATLALFIMDEQQQCIYMNAAAEQLTGFRLAEVKGQALHNVIHHTHPDGRPYALEDCPIDQAFPQNNQEQGEEVFVHKDGSFYPVAYTASPIREGNGVVGTIIEVRDITQDKLNEQARAELDRAKTTFFSNISHELRTPLTLVLGEAEEALADAEEPLSPRQRDRLEVMQRNGQRLLKLVNTLLDVSRLESGRTQATYEPTDLAMYTTELASVFRSTIERAGLQLVVDCPPLPEAIYVDREMWEKIIFNLLSNAFKFTFHGWITVRLRWLDDRVELAVADTGIGIPSEELPHLFERFHRVRGAEGRSFEGSGIGLSLVQELVQLHAGTIDVTSVLGQGSCFTVSIPTGTTHVPIHQREIGHNVAISAERNTDGTVRTSPFLAEALSWLLTDHEAEEIQEVKAAEPGARILLADDNADMREYIKRLLGRKYDVQTVADGTSALNAVRSLGESHLPDLVLTDVMMPGLDGFELLRSLRSDPKTQNIPIILLSARAGEESRLEGLAAGADDYLIKPFSGRELVARVESSLKLAQQRQRSRSREHALRTEAKTAEANLQEVLSTLRDGFFVLDHNWRYLYVNDRQLEIIGMQREAVIGKNIWDFFPDFVGTEFYDHLHHVMREQTPVQFEYHYMAWNRWFENRVYPTPNGISILCAEISDRKQAEAALRESEERYRILAESIPQLVWITNVEGQNEYVNQQFCNYTGLNMEQMLGLDWLDIIHPDDAERTRERWLKSVNEGAFYEIEYRFRRADGVYRWFLGQGTPLKNEQGQITRWFGTCTDIEQQKQVEQERSLVLQQEQAAREAAEQANRIKDEFLAVVSHELRTPMNPILGWSRLLQQGKLKGERAMDAIATIERNAKLQVQLIDDLLDISRILRGKMSLEIAPVDLGMVISSAIETVRLAAEAKSLLIQTTGAKQGVMVNGDAGRLQQVVWNLLSNAVKFTPQGGQITIDLSSGKSHAQIQVTDTGKGISHQFLPHVFEHFRQEDGATTRKFGGLGLGLAIVRQITELHGGVVGVDSLGEGQGATFTVKVPLATHQVEVAPASASEPSANLRDVQILVVEDEADSRDILTFMLEQEQAIVTAVSSAAEALYTIEQSTPDLIISDIGMPEMNGYRLMQLLRAMPRGKTIPAIALTAYAAEYDQQQALKAGFQQHLAKPIDPNQLVQAIFQELGKSHS